MTIWLFIAKWSKVTPLSTKDPSSPPRLTQDSPRAPWDPQGPPHGPLKDSEAPPMTLHGLKMYGFPEEIQRFSYNAKSVPEVLWGPPKRPQAPKGPPQGPSRDPQASPRTPQGPPRTPKDLPRTPQGHPSKSLKTIPGSILDRSLIDP